MTDIGGMHPDFQPREVKQTAPKGSQEWHEQQGGESKPVSIFHQLDGDSNSNVNLTEAKAQIMQAEANYATASANMGLLAIKDRK